MSTEKELKITVVDYATFTDIEFSPPSNWFFKDAMGNFIFCHTSKREVVQEYINENYGVNKYKPIPTKDQKGKSKQENGGQSVYATASRARPSSRPPK